MSVGQSRRVRPFLRITLKTIGNLGAVFVGIALALGIASTWLPRSYVSQFSEKLPWFTSHRNRYDVLFLGSSRVRRHIKPSLFDQLTAQEGMRIRSFNFGMAGLNHPEDAYVLEQILKANPSKLRWVFVELTRFRSDFVGQDAGTARAAYWHDYKRTALTCRQLIHGRYKPLDQFDLAAWFNENWDLGKLLGAHLNQFIHRELRMGDGSSWFQLQTRPAGEHPLIGERLLRAPLGPNLDGFVPFDENHLVGNYFETYQQRVDALNDGAHQEIPFDPVAQENLESMLSLIRAHGASPILFIAPGAHLSDYYPSRKSAPLLDFSDPRKFPILFEKSHRTDAEHLNSAGAEVFTRELFRHALPFMRKEQ